MIARTVTWRVGEWQDSGRTAVSSTKPVEYAALMVCVDRWSRRDPLPSVARTVPERIEWTVAR